MFSELGKAVLIEVVDLLHIAFLNHVVEVLELLDWLRDGVLHPVHGWVPSVAISRVLVIIVLIIRIHVGHDATEEISL